MQNFEGPGPNGASPPDPDLARGYDHVVCVTNDDFAVYDACGALLFYSDVNDYLGLPDALLFAPRVVFDPWAGRWVMMYHLVQENPQTSELVVVVTADAEPFGLTRAWVYRFDVLQDGGTGNASWADYFDLGYSETQLFASGNMFKFSGGFRWGRLIFFSKADMYAGGAASYLWWSNLLNRDGSLADSPRSCRQQVSWREDGAYIDGMFCNSRSGGGNRITFWKASDVFGADDLAKAETAVGDYILPPPAEQPTGWKLDTLDCRLMPAVVTMDYKNGNGIELFTSLNGWWGWTCRTLLYKFDAESLALEFELLYGSQNADIWFASPAADFTGSNFWVFSRTSTDAGEQPEIRYVHFNQGAFDGASMLMRDGDGSYSGFYWGRYFGGQLDWGDYSANGGVGSANKVWLYAQYGDIDSWGTHVGASSAFPQGSMSNVTPTSTFVISGPEGGPFSPISRDYVLESDSGDTGVAFRVASLPSWLDASSDAGQLWGDKTVTLSVNSSANNRRPGTYSDTIYFTDCFNGGKSFARDVQLIVECGADFNGDGAVDTRDVLAFLNAWSADKPDADCDGNGRLDTRDVLCFLNVWSAGC